MELARLPFIRKILDSGGEVYLVGGTVRDLFLKLPGKDYDLLVCKLSDEKISSILKPFGSVNQVGRSFGILKFRPTGATEIEFDFSLPRIEKSTGTGHRDFEVDFNPNIPVEEDLARRDFTINAMALNLADEKLVDPFGGEKDLKAKKLRQVFLQAFVEDPLRLLRAVQFSARLGFEIEQETYAAMKKHAELIKTVSPERVALEIGKLFRAKKPSMGFDLMRETGILPLLFPFVSEMIGILQPMKKNEDVYTHTMKVLDAAKGVPEMENPGTLNLMFAALLHDAGKPKTVGFDKEKDRVTFYGHQIVSRRIAAKWLDKYRISILGVDIPKILNIIEGHMFETKAFFSDKAIRRFINKIGKEDIFDLIDLRIADKKGGRYPESMKGILNLRNRIHEEIERKVPFSAKDLAITGHDLMALGHKPGPMMGQILAYLVDRVLDEPEWNTKEKLAELIGEKFTP